ncbi:MAG: hypothetical protein H6908_00695 [Hyphomicrobiales bacterium]|nr:hypothetical protein [Rickettsiales bacterium]MCP5361148.1 hypothetical protein [Hyphomicrobiales bacterium]
MKIAGAINEELPFQEELNQLIIIAHRENAALRNKVIKHVAGKLTAGDTPSFRIMGYIEGLGVDYTRYYGEESFNAIGYSIMATPELSKIHPTDEVLGNIRMRLSGVLGSLFSAATKKRTINFDTGDFVPGELLEEGMTLIDAILEKLGKKGISSEEKVKTARDAVVEKIYAVIAEEIEQAKQKAALAEKHSIGSKGGKPR